MALLAILGLLIIEDIQDDLPDFLGWGATTGEIFKYYLFLIPSFLPLVLPLALLVSVLFTLGNLHRRNEITAMRAAGLNLASLTRSLIGVGAIMALLVLYLNASLVPYSVEQSRTIRSNLRFSSEAKNQDQSAIGIVHTLTFDNRSAGRLWLMNRFSEYTYQGYGVTVYLLNQAGQDIGRIMARRAYYDDVDHAWVMEEGRELKFDPVTGEAIFERKFDTHTFADFGETPALMKTLSKAPSELSYLEISELLQTIPPKENPDMLSYAVREQMILASPFVSLIAVALAIPFAVSGVRTHSITNVVKAGLLFFAYFALASLCQILGNQQLISPIVAAWTPNCILGAYSIGIWRRTW